MKDFAGTTDEQVDVLRRTPGWDAVAEAGQDWTLVDAIWAAVRPARSAEGARPRWRITTRRCDVAVGDRVVRAVRTLEVREVIADPAFPDRLMIVGEEVA